MDHGNCQPISDLNTLTDPVNSSSPMMRLNQDVLWRTFSMNADMDNDEEFRVYSNDILKNKNSRALFTTWHSSQVCQIWRHTILNAPSLWAQLIDLDGLSSVDKLMKEEIICRTASCSLYIAGHVFASSPKERDFFLSILLKDWTRIQSLKVTIGQSNEIPGNVWNILLEPTKTLVCFKLRASNGVNLPQENHPISNLFANHAPSLKSFVSWKINFNFGYGDGLNWLSNIRQLNISYMSSMPLPQWLEALQHMPLLEDLQLMYPFPSVAPSLQNELNLPTIHLPKLMYIYIIHSLNSCAVLLDRIVPRIGCYLYMDTLDDVHEPPPPSTILLATKVLSRYSQSFFANHPISALHYAVTHTAITISEYRLQHHDTSPMYRVYVCCGDPAQLSLLFPLLDAYTSCDFSNVETLRFDVDLFPAQTLNIDVFNVLLRFNSIKSLVFSNEGTIPALSGLAREYMDTLETSGAVPFPLFPHLHTIKADGAYNFPGQIPGAKEAPLELLLLQQNLARFVIWRRVVQAPVEVIDIADLGAAARVGIFDGISGLQIIIRTEF